MSHAAFRTFRPPSIEDRAAWKALAERPSNVAYLEKVLARAESLPPRPPMPAASDYLAARRFNDRGRLDQHWRGVLPDWTALVVRRLVRGLEDDDLDDRLLDWTWDHLTQGTWVVSAHLPGKDLPAGDGDKRAQPDLAACERAMFLAELRECLLPWLNRVSGTLADRIVYEIDARVLAPYGDGLPVWWDSRPFSNNWLGVCAGNILGACLSLEAQGLPRPKARDRAIAGLQKFFRDSFTPDGECDEGMGYWAYGVGFACHGLRRLSRDVFEKNFDLERIARVADYPRRAHLVDDRFYCGNDGGMMASAGLSFVPWLAETAGNAWLRDWARAYPARGGWTLQQALRLLDAPGLGDSPGALPSVDTAPRWLPDQQAAILRTGALTACLSGGTNAENHNHNDLGHVVLLHDRDVVLPDLGAPVYTSDFFGPKRYGFLAASSRGHSCPVVGGCEQRAGKEAAGEVVAWEPEVPRLALALASAYPEEAGLTSWVRSLRASDGAFHLQDDFQTAEGGVAIEHVLWSTKPVTAQDDAVRTGPLRCAFAPSPEEITVEAVQADEHGLRVYAGKTLYRICARYRTDGDGRLEIATSLHPAAD